jgi:hypothetical protein
VSGASVSGPVVVTGATGFLGEHLCAELLRRGVAVRALARTRSDYLADLGAEVVRGDVRSAADLDRVLPGAVAVFHLAHGVAEPDDTRMMRLHVDGTRAVCEAMAPRRRRMILASTSCTIAVSEDDRRARGRRSRSPLGGRTTPRRFRSGWRSTWQAARARRDLLNPSLLLARRSPPSSTGDVPVPAPPDPGILKCGADAQDARSFANADRGHAGRALPAGRAQLDDRGVFAGWPVFEGARPVAEAAGRWDPGAAAWKSALAARRRRLIASRSRWPILVDSVLPSASWATTATRS